MENEQLEFDFERHDEEPKDSHKSEERVPEKTTKTCKECGKEFYPITDTPKDICPTCEMWKNAQEDKEDKEDEYDRLYRRRFSKDANPQPKQPKPKRRPPAKWEKRIELNDWYDNSVAGEEVKVVSGKGRGEIGVIQRVHNGQLYIDTKRHTDLEKDPTEVRGKLESVFMDALEQIGLPKYLCEAIGDIRRAVFDDEPGYAPNKKDRSPVNDDDVYTWENAVDGEREDDEDGEIKELEREICRLRKKKETLEKELRDIPYEHGYPDEYDAAADVNRRLGGINNRIDNLVKERDDKKYGVAVVNEPSAKYLRNLRKEIK